jgi:hypothetical protein
MELQEEIERMQAELERARRELGRTGRRVRRTSTGAELVPVRSLRVFPWEVAR